MKGIDKWKQDKDVNDASQITSLKFTVTPNVATATLSWRNVAPGNKQQSEDTDSCEYAPDQGKQKGRWQTSSDNSQELQVKHILPSGGDTRAVSSSISTGEAPLMWGEGMDRNGKRG